MSQGRSSTVEDKQQIEEYGILASRVYELKPTQRSVCSTSLPLLMRAAIVGSVACCWARRTLYRSIYTVCVDDSPLSSCSSWKREIKKKKIVLTRQLTK
jgi:hypothetical protein